MINTVENCRETVKVTFPAGAVRRFLQKFIDLGLPVSVSVSSFRYIKESKEFVHDLRIEYHPSDRDEPQEILSRCLFDI